MSDNKTVPSAETILDTFLTDYPWRWKSKENAIKATHEHTRLHLEAMLKEITSGDEKVLLKRDIEKTGNNYITKIK